jgi:hypothetical protein
MRYMKLYFDSGKYYYSLVRGKGMETDKTEYPGDKEGLKELVSAYRNEGISALNGNLDEKMFNEITGKEK